ncbi:hypothetical protein PTTG_27538 [Puccinia triticina 1-1 BBBD Race 1]|uniref:DUF6589 domain-containing protein n=2 Tax=Puccinia triticina TaxID=208348 RepID=A0A180GJ26_PUCT1|nr:hypothetical protein PTTG_27538 [Puccinia triticina 1-1 BBBD Race 1]
MTSHKLPMTLIICLDNLDFEESIHEKSIEKTTQMFHGTWGYLHVPDAQLISQFDPEEFSLKCYQKAIQDSADMQVEPSWFLPDNDSRLHFWDVLKTVKKPEFLMFKLMIASDNSSKGVVLEGDLATCMNLKSLRAQRKPSGHVQDNLSAVFLLHFGNPSDSQDLGAWHTLSSLGIPSERPTTKKDFTLMLTHMTKCHEATIVHCLLTVMNLPKALLPEEKAKLSSQRLNEIVDLCSTQFFSPAALQSASADSATGLKNTLLWLRDFATIIECDHAMRAGDIGRVLNMWKRWTVMAHGIKGLNNYAIYLPRMILLLTKVLPSGLAKTLLHSLLINPTGRPNHFVAKDFFLKNNNFWLKYFYNHSGIGTEICRLKDLRKLVQGIKGDLGKNIIYQSHKHYLTISSINSYLGMAQQHSLLSKTSLYKLKTVDIYKAGSAALHQDYQQKKKKLNRMQPSTILLYYTPTGPIEEANMFDKEEEDEGDNET